MDASEAIEKSETSGRYPHLFKSQLLREAYERLVNDPDVKNLTEELALSRLLVAGMVAKVNAKSIEDLSASDAAGIAAMLDQVTRVTDAMARIEAKLQVTISASQLSSVTDQAAKLFYQELLGLTRLVHDPMNQKEIVDALPEVLKRVAAGLEATAVPFSPTRWSRQNPDKAPPQSAMAQSAGTELAGE